MNITNQNKETYSYRKCFDYQGVTLYIYWDNDYGLAFGVQENKWFYQELNVDILEEEFDLEMYDFEEMYDNADWDKFEPILDKLLNEPNNKLIIDKIKES